MAYVKNTIRAVLFLIFGMLFWYVLPQHDVVRITGTEILRMDFSSVNRIFFAQADSASAELATRDIRLINTVKRKTILAGFVKREAEGVMVYRNEDTGWIWPPYFKFDSSDLQAEAQASVSTNENERWAVITHYGWRNRFFTIYPNAIGIRPVDGPDVRVIPWFSIVFFVVLIVGLLFIRAMWRQFWERTIDPLAEDAGEAWDRVDAHADQAKGRLSRWLNSWKSK